MKVLCRGLATAKSTYSKSLAKSQLINAPEQPNHEGANPSFPIYNANFCFTNLYVTCRYQMAIQTVGVVDFMMACQHGKVLRKCFMIVELEGFVPTTNEIMYRIFYIATWLRLVTLMN